jgi:hypothetical protein
MFNRKLCAYFATALFAGLLVPLNAASPRGYFETTGGGQTFISLGTGHPIYAPSAIITLDGTTVLFFAQGQDGNPSYRDSVFLWTVNIQLGWAGLTNPPAIYGRIYGDSQFHYRSPSVFTDANKYFLTVCRAPAFGQPPLQEVTDSCLLSSSQDGKSGWDTFQTLFTTPTATLNIASMSLKATTIGGTPYWFGLLEVRDVHTNVEGVAGIRIKLNSHSYAGINRIEVKAGGVWTNVCLGCQLPSNLDIAVSRVSQPKIHWIDGGWQVWTSNDNVHVSCGCHGGTVNGTVNSGFTWFWFDENFTVTFPTYYNVWSNNRCLPSDYSNGRSWPERLETQPLLYSMSNDANCSEYYDGAYIVVTQIGTYQ